jgi:hypothetical protein
MTETLAERDKYAPFYKKMGTSLHAAGAPPSMQTKERNFHRMLQGGTTHSVVPCSEHEAPWLIHVDLPQGRA